MLSNKELTAFGQEVPAEFIAGLLTDGWKAEELTTENLETLLHYDHADEL